MKQLRLPLETPTPRWLWVLAVLAGTAGVAVATWQAWRGLDVALAPLGPGDDLGLDI